MNMKTEDITRLRIAIAADQRESAENDLGKPWREPGARLNVWTYAYADQGNGFCGGISIRRCY